MYELQVRFGRNVRQKRLDRGFSQERLAGDAEIDLTYMGGIERGRRNPSLLVMARIAKALDVELIDLLAPARALAAEEDEPETV